MYIASYVDKTENTIQTYHVSKSASCVQRYLTTSKCPLMQARWSAVCPSLSAMFIVLDADSSLITPFVLSAFAVGELNASTQLCRK